MTQRPKNFKLHNRHERVYLALQHYLKRQNSKNRLYMLWLKLIFGFELYKPVNDFIFHCLIIVAI